MGQQTSTVTKASDFDPTQARLTGADGGTPIDTEIIFGQDDHGTDFKVFGDTSGVYMLWDESADFLKLVKGGIQIGTLSSTAQTGYPLTSTNNNVIDSFADDNNTTLDDAVYSNIRARTMLFKACTAGTIISVKGQIKLADEADMGPGVFAGVQGYMELYKDADVKSGGKFWCVDASVDVPTTGTFTVDSGGIMAGLHAELTGLGTLTDNGITAGLYIDEQITSGQWGYGVYIADDAAATGIAIGSCTTGITVTSASGYALDIQTTGQLRMGIQGTGIPTATATPHAVEIHAETNADAIIEAVGGGCGFTSGIRCRYEISKAQTAQVGFQAIEGRLRPKAAMADGVHCGISGTIEADAATAFTGTATTQRNAGNFCIELGSTCTFGSTSGWLTGVTIDSSIHGTQTGMSNITFPALRIKKSGSKMAWQYGIYMDAGGCTDGIYLSATTKAHEMVVTALPADARGARYAFTCATPAMTDGYGAHEIDLTVGGTATGATIASSCWINAGNSATLASGNYAWVHNDGVWLGNSCTATGAVIVYARVQFVFGTNTSYSNLHLFDLNLDIDQDMTSLINVNNLALTGFTAGTHSSAVTGSIPFIGTGGSVKYIRVYDSAA